MGICNIKQAQNMFAFYSAYFCSQFPELEFSCDETTFCVDGIIRRYEDITGMSCNKTHFLIEMERKYLLCLPMMQGEKMCILKKQLLQIM